MTARLNLRTLEQQESETLETYADQVLGAVMIGYAGFSESHWNRMAIEAFILGCSCHEAKRIVLNKNLVHWIGLFNWSNKLRLLRSSYPTNLLSLRKLSRTIRLSNLRWIQETNQKNRYDSKILPWLPIFLLSWFLWKY